MDREDLETWLNTRAREDAILIAQRAALRVFPIWASRMAEEWARERALTCTLLLRCFLTSGAARRYPTPEVRAAARAAAAAAAAPYAGADATYAYAYAAAAYAADAAAAAVAYAADDAADLDAAYAADAAAYAADAAAYTALWEQVEQDVAILQSAGDLPAAPLWHSDLPAVLLEQEQQGLEILARETGNRNSFWHRWYFAAKRGDWLDWDLQHKVTLIPNDIWEQGPKAVIAAIDEIELAHGNRHLGPNLAEGVANLAPPATGAVAAVRQAMERNRQALPPTFDAIQGLIALEIDRLLRRNYTDDLDQIECHRQISIYLTLNDAICAFRESLPASGPVTEVQAAKSESLLRLYADKFRQLPFAKADEVVEGTWEVAKGGVKAGLIGGSALLAMSYGLPSMAGVTIGAMVFAPKNAVDLIKAAREALASKP